VKSLPYASKMLNSITVNATKLRYIENTSAKTTVFGVTITSLPRKYLAR